jgi:hypothetical protein
MKTNALAQFATLTLIIVAESVQLVQQGDSVMKTNALAFLYWNSFLLFINALSVCEGYAQ